MNLSQKGMVGKGQGRGSVGGRRRIRQLVVCLLLFGVIVVGRGMHWEPVEQVVKTMGRLVGADTDYQAVFSILGESVSKKDSLSTTVRNLVPSLFPSDETQTQGTEPIWNEEDRLENP